MEPFIVGIDITSTKDLFDKPILRSDYYGTISRSRPVKRTDRSGRGVKKDVYKRQYQLCLHYLFSFFPAQESILHHYSSNK